MTIGRDSSCDVVVAQASVSHRHFSLEPESVGDRDVIVLRDAGSRNGVFVNSQRVDERVVAPGDLIRFGGCRLEILRVAHTDSTESSTDDQTAYCPFRLGESEPDAVERLRALHEMALSLSDLEVSFMLERTAEIVSTCVEFETFTVLPRRERTLRSVHTLGSKRPCAPDTFEHSRVADRELSRAEAA